MTKKFFLLFLLISLIGNAQNIFKYEKEIKHKKEYNFIEIEFFNSIDEIKLSGTLIEPKKDYDKIVVIIPGSTEDTRHSHFILAEELLKNGIAVYRFDERGIAKSEGSYTDSATKLSQDLSSLFKKLKISYKDKKIGFVGHSRGGMASLEMIQSGLNPAFLILIGTPVLKNGNYILNRIEKDIQNNPSIIEKGKTEKESIELFRDMFKILADNSNSRDIKEQTKELLDKKGFNRKYLKFLKDFLSDDVFMELVRKDYETVIRNLSIPTLYFVGSDDAILNAKLESDYIKSFKNEFIEVKIFEDLNHYLTEKNAPVGTSLYKMDKAPLNKIISWILKK